MEVQKAENGDGSTILNDNVIGFTNQQMFYCLNQNTLEIDHYSDFNRFELVVDSSYNLDEQYFDYGGYCFKVVE